MAILVDRKTRVLVQGITGREGTFHAKQMMEYGTAVVGGVTPGKGGTKQHGVPVYNTMAEAVKETGADASVIFVPAEYASDAMIEAADAGLKLVVAITEGVPVHDMLVVRRALDDFDCRLIGPNCPGIITPGECKAGIMPGYIHKPGGIGVISRSGTLTYEAVYQITSAGLGQSTCIGIGGDPVIGLGFVDCLELFREDDRTEAVLMIGEIGGSGEELAARHVSLTKYPKPVFAYAAGMTAPPGRRMGHAGAIISGSTGTAQGKVKALEEAGITVIKDPTEIGKQIAQDLKSHGR